MTERIGPMLHDAASDILVPPVPAAQILLDGRRRRRRTRAASALAGAAVLVLVGATTVAALGHGSGQAVDPAKIATFQQWGAVAVGRDVYVGDEHVVAPGDISAMYYTAEGVVIRTGGDYELVRADGQVTPIGVHIPDRIPGFEPDSTRFAYAERDGSRWQVVVHDAATDEEVARIPVDGTFTWGGWEAPPVAIDGDHVWVHFDGRWTDVAWRTGAVHDVPGTADTYEVANGSYAVQRGRYSSHHHGAWEVRSWTDGSLLGTATLPRGWYGFFSPDGGFLRAFDNEGPGEAAPIVYDVATGESRRIAGEGAVGWTPDGDLLVVEQDRLSVCTPITDACRSRTFDRGTGNLRIGGNPYES